MNTSKVKGFFKGIKHSVGKHSPEILMGIGIAGMVTTAVLAVKATPKALDLIAEAEDEKGERLSKKETVEAAWKCYIPATVTGISSVACLIGSSKSSAKKYAALTTAYKLAETTLSDYKEKVVETIGEEKEKIVREKVAEKKLEKHPVNNEVYISGDGDQVFFDALTGRYFKSDINTIDRAVNKLNAIMISDINGYMTLNEFYSELGIENVEVGEVLGWNLLHRIQVDYTTKLTDDGKACIVLDYIEPPFYNYDAC